jgi:hypothetical protein
MASPESSTRAGQPPSAHRSAIAATIAGSFTMCASPSITKSKSWSAMLNVQRGSRSRFLPLRVLASVSNQNAPSTHSAPIPVTCGLPSLLIVANQHVCRFGPPVPGACGKPPSSRPSTRAQSSSGVP